MNWEQPTELFKILQAYASSAFIAMLTIHIFTIFLRWLTRLGRLTIRKEGLPNHESVFGI